MKKIILLVGVSILMFSCINKAKNKTDILNEPIKKCMLSDCRNILSNHLDKAIDEGAITEKEKEAILSLSDAKNLKSSELLEQREISDTHTPTFTSGTRCATIQCWLDELEDYEESNFVDDNTSSFFVYDDMISLFSGNETWLYKKNKSEYFYKGFEHPNNLFENIENKVKYDDISIYYEENGYWKFIGNLSTTRVRSGLENLTSGSKHIYFKSGYRVAYSVNGEEPIEIVFEENQWEVK